MLVFCLGKRRERDGAGYKIRDRIWHAHLLLRSIPFIVLPAPNLFQTPHKKLPPSPSKGQQHILAFQACTKRYWQFPSLCAMAVWCLHHCGAINNSMLIGKCVGLCHKVTSSAFFTWDWIKRSTVLDLYLEASKTNNILSVLLFLPYFKNASSAPKDLEKNIFLSPGLFCLLQKRWIKLGLEKKMLPKRKCLLCIASQKWVGLVCFSTSYM